MRLWSEAQSLRVLPWTQGLPVAESLKGAFIFGCLPHELRSHKTKEVRFSFWWYFLSPLGKGRCKLHRWLILAHNLGLSAVSSASTPWLPQMVLLQQRASSTRQDQGHRNHLLIDSHSLLLGCLEVWPFFQEWKTSDFSRENGLYLSYVGFGPVNDLQVE